MNRRTKRPGKVVPFLPPDLRPFDMRALRKKPSGLGSYDSDQIPTPFGGSEYDQ